MRMGIIDSLLSWGPNALEQVMDVKTKILPLQEQFQPPFFSTLVRG